MSRSPVDFAVSRLALWLYRDVPGKQQPLAGRVPKQRYQKLCTAKVCSYTLTFTGISSLVVVPGQPITTLVGVLSGVPLTEPTTYYYVLELGACYIDDGTQASASLLLLLPSPFYSAPVQHLYRIQPGSSPTSCST